MSKLIATLVAGFISIGAFASTSTTPTAVAPTNTQKPAQAPSKEIKKVVHKAANKSSEKIATPTAKAPAIK